MKTLATTLFALALLSTPTFAAPAGAGPGVGSGSTGPGISVGVGCDLCGGSVVVPEPVPYTCEGCQK